MMTTPAINTMINAMADSTDLKNGAARKSKKKLPFNSPAEEADEKRRGIKDTPQEEAAEIRMNNSRRGK